MTEKTLPQYWRDPDGVLETVIRDEHTLDIVLAEFREQLAGQKFFASYDCSHNLRRLLVRAELFNNGVVTASVLVNAFNALVLLNKNRNQVDELEFIPVAEIEERETKAQNEHLRQLYREYQRFFDSCTSAQNREREKTDPGYKKYVEREKKRLSGPADPKPIVSELFPNPVTAKAIKAPVAELTQAERNELEQFAARFRTMTSEEARHASNAAFVGRAAADEFNSLAARAQKSGILPTYSNL